ncbi:MAG: hypothetical protein Q8S13_05430, partial [Dehalococcoidia bacterium]|nr:hypothetical protein [Dehalococcoidia bacterium]
MTTTEYRVVWKRVGAHEKSREYTTRRGAERFMVLFGPEPWNAYDRDKGPDGLMCCGGLRAGYMCGCDGITIRQQHEAKRKDLAPLEYLRLEGRTVGAWTRR